ncbi:hypothetical protein QFZ40_002237 [Arthrobacter pascens]|nr:hypothetical protein [Arthrobacter pascens]
MAKRGSAVHVVRVKKSHTGRNGQEREYRSAYTLRRT